MSRTNSKIFQSREHVRRNTPVTRDVYDETEEDIASKEKETQTSKTILQLAQLELESRVRIPPQKETEIHKNENLDEGSNDLHFERKSDIYYSTVDMPLLQEEAKKKGLSLTRLFLSKPSQVTDEVASTVDSKELDNPPDEGAVEDVFTVPQWSRFSIKEIRVKSVDASNNFMYQDYKIGNNTGSVPEIIAVDKKPEKVAKIQIPSVRRGRSISPNTSREVADQSQHSSDTTSFESSDFDSLKFKDYFHMLTSQVKSKDWNISLKALVEIAERSKTFDPHRVCTHMTDIHQRLIEFLRSPRSQVCRTACQVAGKLFESIKDTRRPEFDDIVELLLMKTADSNKFIRKDANLALDSMIMNISHFHTIRAISQKGPMHKNDLIRISSARLYVCIVGIAGVNVIMNQSGNDSTRQRIFVNMTSFIKDKNFKTREYGIRLYRLLREHPNFDFYLKKLIDKNRISEIKKIMKKV